MLDPIVVAAIATAVIVFPLADLVSPARLSGPFALVRGNAARYRYS